MAVAWIGNREVPVAHAIERAAELLGSSRCPVFSIDTDVHGTRAALALAERVGATYDHVNGAALAHETALLTDRGGLFVAPGEAARRADLIAMVGELPAHHHAYVAHLADTQPDLADEAAAEREFFLIGPGSVALPNTCNGVKTTRLTCGNADLNGTLAAIRAQCAGRNVATPVSNIDQFRQALDGAQFAVFLFSGHSTDVLGHEMLQGLISDLSRKKRASAVHLPAHESGWGSALVSTWTTGFPLRTSFSRSFPEYDPWRWHVARMVAEGEADLHLWTSSANGGLPSGRDGMPLVVLAKTSRPAAGAAVTIAIGEPGIDHDAVSYASRIGTLAVVEASAASDLPSAATVLRSMADSLPHEAALPC